MNWTISRRIVSGFTLVLLLVAIVTGVGAWALRTVTDTYEHALAQRRINFVPALQLESELQATNMAYLRFLLEGFEVHARARDSIDAVARGLLMQLRDSAETDVDRQAWSNIATTHQRWFEQTDSAMAAKRAKNEPRALYIRANVEHPIRLQLDSMIQGEVNRARASATQTAAVGASTAESSRVAVMVGGILALFAGIISAMLLNRSITRPLQETSTVIASGSTEILAATTEQAASANETLAAVSETVATVDEVTQTAEQAAERARAVADSAQRAAEMGKAGRRAVEDSVAGTQQVRDQVESIGRSILSLAEQAQAIGEIITAVNDIA
jgi:methyl-accepting chemotaxis protein